MPQTTDLTDFSPRIESLRTLTKQSVSVDLSVWWHRFYDGRDGLPTAEWKVVTFHPDHTVKAFRAPDLETALAAAETYHGYAAIVGVVVTP